jgi:hypothetical protein
VSLRLPLFLLLLPLAACVQGGATSSNDPETVGGIIECRSEYFTNPLGKGRLEFIMPQWCEETQERIFDPNLVLIDCTALKQIVVFNSVEQTGPHSGDYRLTGLGPSARSAMQSGGLAAVTRVLTAAGEDGKPWGLGEEPAEACAAAG